MCQQGGLGDGASGQEGIIMVGYCDLNKNGDFGVGDELFGIDGITGGGSPSVFKKKLDEEGVQLVEF